MILPGGAGTAASGDPGGLPGDSTRTLAIDVGGSGLKAAVLDAAGAMISDRARVGPYAYLPAGSHVGKGVMTGAFYTAGID